jgi:hypothetical protein
MEFLPIRPDLVGVRGASGSFRSNAPAPPHETGPACIDDAGRRKA